MWILWDLYLLCGIFRFHNANNDGVNRAVWCRLLGGPLIGHMLTVDKRLISLTGADRHNDIFVISGRPNGGTDQFRPDRAAFSGSITPMMAVSAGQNGADCLED